LAHETDLHTSTASRLIGTLEHLGALEREDGRLVIGPEIVSLASRTRWTEQLTSLATPHLRELASSTQEATGLAQIEGNECVIFYQILSNHIVQVRDWTGERFPLHVTSIGKLYLAELSAKKLKRFFAQPLDKFAPNTKITLDEFQDEIQQIQRDGIAWAIDELEDGLTSVAAPLYDQEDNFVAGLYVCLPSYRVEERIDLVQQVQATAHAISSQWSNEKRSSTTR